MANKIISKLICSDPTPANTGLSIKRSKNSFTASWKIKTKKATSQKIRYRTYNGTKWSGWTTKSVSKSATSYTFSFAATSTIQKIQFQTKIRREDYDSSILKINYEPSKWSSSSTVYTITAPPVPSLTVSNDSANKTTFSWSISASDDNTAWYDRCYYRTKNSTTPDDSTGWSAWTHAASGSYTYTDNTIGTTRIFQIKASGPAGYSAVVTQRHMIRAAPVATWETPQVSCTEKASYYQMTYNVNIAGSAYNVDDVVPQYYIGMPAANMACPGGASFTDGSAYSYTGSKTKYALAITTSDVIDEDECLWARVKTSHDSTASYSEAYRVITGKLKSPICTISVGTPTPAGFSVDVTLDNVGTGVPGAYAQVFLEKYSAPGLENYILIGTLPNGTTTATITSTEDITDEDGYSIHVRNVTADGISMASDFYTYATTMPSAPTLDSVEPTTTKGKVYLSWTNNWPSATGTIIAWTDDPDNWMSNEEPATYEITEKASNWFITGLETGKTWYFRIRSIYESGDNITRSPWSKDIPIDLAEAPAVPVLYLSEQAITEDGMVTAYWSYVSSDGTGQVSGNVVEATYTGGVWTYGDSVGATTTAQHIDIYAADNNGWTEGTVVYLALQTRSGSGGQSEYSTPVQLAIADKPTVAISSTGFDASEDLVETFEGDGVTDTFVCAQTMTGTPAVTVEGVAATVSSYTDGVVVLSAAPDEGDTVVIEYTTADNEILSSMPLTATIATTNAAELTIAVERAAAYPMLRPDGTETDGAEGETVYVNTIPAEATNSISIEVDELIGRVDDGAFYNLVATVKDIYGQTEETKTLFKVHWTHQAWVPTATFITDATNYIARITPVAGEDYVSGDTCDIYRLSVDGPELIYTGADFGTEYVDPYPAFGVFSGYKLVTVTENGDYITENDMFSEYDSTEDENEAYTQMDPQTLVIDFDGYRVELPYNITLGNSWAKDFQRTAYLGGSVVGDHNRAVTRDISAASVLVSGDDELIGVQMRALSRYAGLCHVRTPEGSSFTADVQVSESRAYNSASLDYNLSIQKVDPVGYDGMTYAEWSEMQ